MRELLLQELKNLAVVRKVGNVELNVRADKRFERSLAFQQFGGQSENEARMRSGQHEERVKQRVRLDQSAIQIDAKGRDAGCWRIWLGDKLGQWLPRVRAPAART